MFFDSFTKNILEEPMTKKKWDKTEIKDKINMVIKSHISFFKKRKNKVDIKV